MRSLLLPMLVPLAGCVALPAATPVERLDERTGVTLVLPSEPLVFARERRDVAVNARDYLTLAALERNKAGRRDVVLLCYRWSTIDRRVNPMDDWQAQTLVIVIDGRDLRLEPLGDRLPEDLRPRPELHRPPVGNVTATAYRASRSTLEIIAAGHDLQAFFADARGSPAFRLWRDGREALRRFLAAVSAGSD